jgi:hypothetical protein
MTGVRSRDPFDTMWHAYIDGKAYGPYSGHTIRTMVEKEEFFGTDLVVGVRQSDWHQAKDDPILRLLFADVVLSEKRGPVRYTARRGRRINRIAGVMLLLGFGWVIWPYYSVYDLVTGLKAGDVQTLQKRVDWNTVRQSLRGDVNASLLRSQAKDQSDFSRGLTMTIGPALIGQMIDGYVTPQAIARLMQDDRASTVSSSTTNPPAANQNVRQTISQFSSKQVAYAFFSGSPFSFRIDVRSPNPQVQGLIKLHFSWHGDWTLDEISLPWDDIEKLQATNR